MRFPSPNSTDKGWWWARSPLWYLLVRLRTWWGMELGIQAETPFSGHLEELGQTPRVPPPIFEEWILWLVDCCGWLSVAWSSPNWLGGWEGRIALSPEWRGPCLESASQAPDTNAPRVHRASLQTSRQTATPGWRPHDLGGPHLWIYLAIKKISQVILF